MHEDHDVSRQSRQKDTLSAEDLGILLQWHWKYGTAAFTNERQRVQLSLLIESARVISSIIGVAKVAKTVGESGTRDEEA
jgi:hypothetical protein